MRDELVEVLVKCKPKTGLAILRILCFVLCAICVLLGTAVMGGWLFFIAAVVFGLAGYFAGLFSQVEYEYTYCDKEIEIDAIYSQTNRKHITTLELGKMEAFVRVKGDRMSEYANRQFVVRDYSSHDKENADKVYALIYDGSLKILMEPDERLIGAVSYIAPRKVFR